MLLQDYFLVRKRRGLTKSSTARVIAGGVLSLLLALGSQPAYADWLGDRIGDKLKPIAEAVRKAPALVKQATAPRRKHRTRHKARLKNQSLHLGNIGNVSKIIRGNIGQTFSYAANGLEGVENFVSVVGTGAKEIPRALGNNVPRKTVAPALAAAIRNARNLHYPNSRPLPSRIIAVLSKTIPMSALKRARYVQGDMTISLPNLVNGAHKLFAGHDHAMVVDDVIVFSTMPGATTTADIEWWAHEVHHVYQYQVWGVDRFATNYMKNSARIEKRARDVAARAAAVYRKAETSPARRRLSYR